MDVKCRIKSKLDVFIKTNLNTVKVNFYWLVLLDGLNALIKRKISNDFVCLVVNNIYI